VRIFYTRARSLFHSAKGGKGWDRAYLSIAVVGPASRRVLGSPIPYLSFCCLPFSLKAKVVPVHAIKRTGGVEV